MPVAWFPENVQPMTVRLVGIIPPITEMPAPKPWSFLLSMKLQFFTVTLPLATSRRTPQELEAAVTSLGISHDTTVILYGRDTEGHANEKWPGRRAGQIAATRAALILRYAGAAAINVHSGHDLTVRRSAGRSSPKDTGIAETGQTKPDAPARGSAGHRCGGQGGHPLRARRGGMRTTGLRVAEFLPVA